MVRSFSRRVSLVVGALAALLASASIPSVTHAADRVYWSNYQANKISFANLDGTSGGDLATGSATIDNPYGTAIDVAAGRIYWANYGGGTGTKISFAKLDGSGGGDLNTGSATVLGPVGVAIDPAAGKIYWANGNVSANKISFAKLDGSGGGDINTGSATVNNAAGVAIDTAAGRIYWASANASKISFAKLDGTGGGDLNTSGATIQAPIGLALDTSAHRVYWSNAGSSTAISFADLDGTGGGNLNTTGATVNSPEGVAIDPAAGRIYWANYGSIGNISHANLDGTGGGDLETGSATLNFPSFPALLRAPQSISEPTITGGTAPGSTLSCSQGSWAPDMLGSFLYLVPQSFGFQWSVGGTDIPGAGGNSYIAATAGEYRCRVTASNPAGPTSQTSAPYFVSSIPTPVHGGPIPGPSRATLSGVGETNSIFRVAAASTPLTGSTAATRHKSGTVFSFRLDQPATVTIAIQGKERGRRVGHSCRADSRALRRKPGCTRTLRIATLSRAATAGSNKVAFTGRIGGKALKPGHYQAVFAATNVAGRSPSNALNFTIVTR